MTFSELERLLKKNGFKLQRVNGSKRFYLNPETRRTALIHFHGSKEVPTGTLRAIMKAAGIEERN